MYRPGELQSKHILETQIRNSDPGKHVDQEMEEHLVVQKFLFQKLVDGYSGNTR